MNKVFGIEVEMEAEGWYKGTIQKDERRKIKPGFA